MINRKFGWIPQKPDQRDKKLKMMVRELPSSVDLRVLCTPMLDQGNLGSCTANAIASAYNYEHIRQFAKEFAPSRLFIYYNERAMEGTIKQDAGAVIRDGFKTINKQGVCTETLWPYNISKFASKPVPKCYSEALKDKVIDYLAVDNDPLQMKGCLADGYPFVFGFTVYESFMSIGSDGIMKIPDKQERAEGGHAVMCVGYSDLKQSFIIKNSWGESWGDKGYFYMPYSFMFNRDLTSDFWSIRLCE